jgi:hypothetical protein
VRPEKRSSRTGSRPGERKYSLGSAGGCERVDGG